MEDVELGSTHMHCRVFHTKRAIFFLGVVYLVNGLGMHGKNVELVTELASIVDQCGLPYLLIGDWNMTIDELLSLSWHEHIDPADLMPTG